MRPKIGVLPLYNGEKQTLWINPLYFGGVEQAGGLPLLLPLITILFTQAPPFRAVT